MGLLRVAPGEGEASLTGRAAAPRAATTITELPLGATPRQDRSVEKRRRLLAAAVDEFARAGVAAARIEDIVAEAGVGWGTFFHFFPRKEDVLLALAVEQHAESVRAMEQADGSASLDEVVFAAYDALARSAHPPQVQVAMLRELIASPVRFEKMLAPDTPFHLRIATLLESGQRQGVVRRDIDAVMLARVLNSGVLVNAARVGLPGAVGLPDDADLGATVRVAFRILWAGVARAAEEMEPPAGRRRRS